MGIYYGLNHGYKSKIYPARMFSEERDALDFDRVESVRILSEFRRERFDLIAHASCRREERDVVERAAKFLAELLREISNEEDRAASEKEQAARAAADAERALPVAEEHPDGLLAEPLIEAHTINRDEI